MPSTFTKWVVPALITGSVMLSGCAPPSSSPSKAIQSSASAGAPGEDHPPGDDPGDFFPTTQNTSWTYRIKTGPAEPLRYGETIWPQGNQGVSYAVRGRFVPAMKGGGKSFLLRLRVKGAAARQGPLQYPQGVEVAVDQDDLGIYEHHKQLFWAISRSGRFMASQVMTLPPGSPGAPSGAWGEWGREDGYEMRLAFFGSVPGTSIGQGKDPAETLKFVGVEENVPGYSGRPCLHFIRRIKPSDKQESLLDQGFTEDEWFARNKGLVRLEQKVGGRSAMIWTLEVFTPGTH